MSVIAFIIALLLSGLVVGALGRLLLPGRDPMSILQTIAVGVAASFVAGLVSAALLGRNGGSLLLSVLFAVGIVYLIRRSRRGHAAHGRQGGLARPHRGF
jgi:uncharacterized membrane protein YeaQ/YmgE (transglycosylase-associated protein family)